MNNKIMLSTIIASSFLLSSQVMAISFTTTGVFNKVAPISITEITSLEFGDIDLSTEGRCLVSPDGEKSGSNCLPGGNPPSVGVFQILGDTDAEVTMIYPDTITSTPGIELDIIDGAGTTLNIVDGVLEVRLGGRLNVVDASIAESGAQQISYTVGVVY